MAIRAVEEVGHAMDGIEAEEEYREEILEGAGVLQLIMEESLPSTAPRLALAGSLVGG
jgi:hypothetical protein